MPQIVGNPISETIVIDLDTKQELFRLRKYNTNENNVYGWVPIHLVNEEPLLGTPKFYLDRIGYRQVVVNIKKVLSLL